MNKSDALKILGLDLSASFPDIKKAYQLKASTHHPDKGGNAELFKQCNEAYKLLKALPKCQYCNDAKILMIKKGFKQIKKSCAYCK